MSLFENWELRTENWAKQHSTTVDCQRRVRCWRAPSKECLISSAIVLVARSLISHITHYRDPLRVGFRQMLFRMNGKDLWQRRRGDVIKKEGLVVYSQSGNGAHTHSLCRNYLLLPDQLLWSHNVHRRQVADKGRSRSEEIVERRPDEGFWNKVWFWGCKYGETPQPFICYHTFYKGPLFTWFGQQK